VFVGVLFMRGRRSIWMVPDRYRSRAKMPTKLPDELRLRTLGTEELVDSTGLEAEITS
jgi:hypothetical protein